MRLLLAEDEPATRLLLSRTLQKWGYEVEAVADGDAAFAAFKAKSAPILVTDWEMPGLDGPSLCKAVRAELRGEYLYILLLTQHGDPASVARGLAAGANEFATKPFDPVELRARLENAKRLILLHDQLASSRQLLGTGDARTLLDDVHRRARARRRGYGLLTAAPDAAARLRNATRDGDLVVAFEGRTVVVAEGVGEAEWAEMALRLAAYAAGAVGVAFYDGVANEPFAAVLARAARGKPAR